MLKVLEGGKTRKTRNAQKAEADQREQAAVAAVTAAAVLPLGLDELAREGARMMIAQARASRQRSTFAGMATSARKTVELSWWRTGLRDPGG
jgi:hypothetical protein